jgi:predicted DNA-binding transcriptional regulator YafY
VEATHGRHGGYRLRPGFKLPPLMFTEEEALAVTLGLLAARRLGLNATSPATEGAYTVAVGDRIRALEETIGFTQRAAYPAPADTNVLLTLGSAAQNQRRVWLRYRDAAGAESEREFDPYGLVFHYGRWYLIGLDQRSDEQRAFRVDRIQQVEPRSANFERPPGFDSVEQLARTLSAIPWGVTVEVLLETGLTEAQARLPDHVGSLEETPSGVLLRTQADDLRMAARYLVGLGFDFRVVSPDALRDEVRRLAAVLQAQSEAPAP